MKPEFAVSLIVMALAIVVYPVSEFFSGALAMAAIVAAAAGNDDDDTPKAA